MDLLPGARTIKRRKLAEEEARGPSPSPPPEPAVKEEEAPAAAPEKPTAAKKKSKPLTPYEAQLRDLKEKEREAAEEKEMEETIRSNIEGVRGLAVVEFFQVKPRRPPVAVDDRWKPEWNGRKNFKAFRRSGRPVGESSTRKVKVVEWKGQENGYWEDNEDASGGRGNAETRSDDEETELRVRSWRERREGRAPTPTPHTQTQSTSTATSQGTKRVAVVQRGRTEVKKAKLSFEEEKSESESSSDDDGMKFRLPRRRR
jgi:hypothetical protein